MADCAHYDARLLPLFGELEFGCIPSVPRILFNSCRWYARYSVLCVIDYFISNAKIKYSSKNLIKIYLGSTICYKNHKDNKKILKLDILTAKAICFNFLV